MLSRYGLNRNLAVICSTTFVNVFFAFTWQPLLALHYRALGADDLQVGISFTLMGIARTLFAVFGGALADRYGRKMLLIIPGFAMIPLYFAMGLAKDWATLLALFVAMNMLNALAVPAFTAVIGESAEAQRVARAFSFSETSVIAGMIAGPVAGAALLGVFDIPTLIIINGVVITLTTAIRAWGLSETRHRIAHAARPNLRAALDSNVRWFLVLGTLVATSFAIAFGPFFSLLARDVWHSSEPEINLLWAAGNAACLLGIVLGRMSERWGTRRVLALGALGYGISAAAWGLATSWQWGLAPLLIAFGFSEGAFIAYQTLQTEITTKETRTSVFGVITTTTGVISGFGPTFGAWLVGLGGYALPFIAAGAMGIAAIGAMLPIRKRTREPMPQVEAVVQAE